MGGWVSQLGDAPYDHLPMELPILRTPFTDAFGQAVTSELDEECGDFELRFFDCLEAVGTIRGRQYCKLYYQDFKECQTKYKQRARVGAMRRERHKQYFAGLAGLGPRVPMYSAKAPEFDSYGPQQDYTFDPPDA